MGEVQSMRSEIKMAIAKKAMINDNYINIKDIIAHLEKQGIINAGDGNIATGQVKTQPQGFVYEIKQENGHWEVTYIGNGELEEVDAVITLSVNTTSLTDRVTITMNAKAESGIASYTLPGGSAESVENGATEINKTFMATSNGTYTFTVVNGEGKSVTKQITIDNILQAVIQMSADTTMPTKDNVIVTVTWPQESSKAIKQVQIGQDAWQTVTGSTSQVTVMQNAIVRARVKNTETDIIENSIEIGNIDKTKASILPTAKTVTVDYGTTKEISSYFTIIANGTSEVTDISYVDTSNGNVEVENTNTLGMGTHVIKCTVTKETGATTTATITMIVEPGVYGNLYKISDTEYHLIFNGTGAIAQGYTEAQLVARGTNIRDGSGRTEISEGVYQSTQPWGTYSEHITKVKIEEKIEPRNAYSYFIGLSKITEINNLENLETKNITNMNNMFMKCSSIKNLDVSNWDTSNVTNMSAMFCGCSSLTSLDVSNWDTSNVTIMWNMFQECRNLANIDVSKWNTSKVTSIANMFYNCKSFTNLDVSKFDTSNVNNMSGVFYGCSNITNLDVSKWNTDKVTSMSGVFYECTSLTNLDISKWNTSNVTVMFGMFSYCNSLTNIDVSNFNTSNVTVMGAMFRGCSSMTSIDVSRFNTSNVTSMDDIFYKCENLTSVDVSKWNTSEVTSMCRMFGECNNLTSVDVSNFDTSKVTNMHTMFRNCKKLINIDVSKFKTNNVTKMVDMFGYCNSLKSIDVSGFDTTKVIDMQGMFVQCSSLTSLDLSTFDTSKVTNMQGMFGECSNLKAIYVGDKWTTESVTESNWMFQNDVILKGAIAYDSTKIDATYANWETGYLTLKGVYGNLYKISDTEYHLIFNTTGALAQGYTESQLVEKGTNIKSGAGYTEVSEGVYQSTQPWGAYSTNITKVKIEEKIKPTSTTAYFYGLTEITEIEGIKNLDTSNVTSMNSLFRECKKLSNLDVSEFDTSKVTTMFNLFTNCNSLSSIDVSNWQTGNVQNMAHLFAYCSALTSVDVSKWDTSSVKNMNNMFWYCSSLSSIDVSKWDTGQVTNMSGLFYACNSLTDIDVSNWNTANVTGMNSMFFKCSMDELDISNWNTVNVTGMNSMFAQCRKLISLDLGGWNTNQVDNMGYMFDSCDNLTKIYVGDQWSTNAVTNSTHMFGASTKLSGAISYDSSKIDATYANYTTGYLTYKQQTGVYGNLYKISDTEYHLIFNTTGAIAQGYTESQLVAKGSNIKNGSGSVTNSEGVVVSNQPWGTYSGNITKVKIEGKIYPTSTAYYFTGLSTITGIEGISNIDTSNVISMSLMFNACSSLTSIDVSGFDTSKVTNMIGMFQNCNSVTELDVSGFNTSKVKSMYATFNGCNSLTSLDISDFDTSNVVNMQSMFNGCKGLTSLDVSNFDTSNVTTMRYMFNACYYLKDLDLTNFDTSKVTNMQNMFYACHQIRSIDVSSFDTSNVTDMKSMFWRCDRITNLDISNFNTKNVTNMYQMFYGCGKLSKIYVGNKWTLTNVTDSTEMFKNCTALSGAIAYDDAKVDGSYANHSAGYLTYVNKNDIILVPSTTASGDKLVTAIYGSNLTGAKTLTCTGTAGTDYVLNGTRSVTVKTNQTVRATAVNASGETIAVSLTVTK